jgi:hypothetical protein
MPVFGQGRALAVENQNTFSSDMLNEMCYFITGSCSCEVKQLNPGFDLFIVEPWMQDLERSFVDEAKNPPDLFNPLAYEPEPEEMVEPEAVAETEETAPIATPTPALFVEAEGPPETPMNWGIILGGGVVVLLGIGVALAKAGGGDA